MRSSFSFYLRYILFFLCIQMIFNILFLIIHQSFANDAGIGDQLLSLVIGLKLDISLTGYILGFPTLVLIVFNIFGKEFLKKIIGVYTFIILFCLVMAYFTNLVIYKYWKFPIDRTIFDYISTPGDMLASISLLRVILIFGFIFLVIYLLYFQAYKRLVANSLVVTPKRYWIAAALFLIILPALLLPIRGGLATSPIQTGSVYFHESTFINHSAVNPVWNLVYTMIEGDKMNQTANYYPDGEAQEIMDELYNSSYSESVVLNTTSPNIILILLESFSQPVITELGGNGEAAPNFNKLVKEGIFFNKMFSSGTMTDRAIGAVLGGYPSIPGTCILHYESKAQKLPMLSLKLKSAGYNSTFLYGGDIDFAHIRSFLVMGGFEHIIDDKDFPRSIPRSSWGVPDHFLFQRLMEVSDQASQPFFNVMLTLSSHTPFDMPMEPVFTGTDEITRYMNSVYYTDKFLGEFIETAKTRDWWDQTLIILMADHGFRVGNLPAHEQKQFSIPMLWIGGALAFNDTIISKIGSQTDLPVTLLKQVALPVDDFKFSKDILAERTKSFAYYTFNEGIGFISDSLYSIYSLTTRDYLVHDPPYSEGNPEAGLAYLQILMKDFSGK